MKTWTLMLLLLFMVGSLSTGCDVPGGQSDAATSAAQTATESSSLHWHPGPVTSEFLFVIDSSRDAGRIDPATGRSGFEKAAAHTVGLLSLFTPDDTFDVMTYGGVSTTHFLFGTFVPGTSSNIEQAIRYLRSIVPGGPSPQYSALHDAIAASPATLTRMYFYSASLPGDDPGAPGGVATIVDILTDLPSWLAALNDAELVCVRVGDTPPFHASYMQSLAALAGGTYLQLP